VATKTSADKRLTIWGSPAWKIPTVHGKVTYLSWLEVERERFKQNGVTTHIIYRRNGEVALTM
jgi:hypothetical protein